jgi:hypothetical protein
MSEHGTDLVRHDDMIVVHPQTGELVVDLHTLPAATLADVQLALKQREGELRDMRREVDSELRRRFDDDLAERGIDVTAPQALGHVLIADDFEVRVTGGRERVWDPDELETTLRELIDAGALDARDCIDVIEHRSVVRGSEAKRLLDRADSDIKAALRRCHTWQRKGDGRGYVRVDRAVALPPNQQ